MTSAEARPLIPFLRYLGAFPDPGGVAQALARGPLAPYEAFNAHVVVAAGDELVTVSAHGFSRAGTDRYQGISIQADMPLCVSFRENRTLVTDTSRLLADFPALALDRDLWEALRDRIGDGHLVSVPVPSQGVVVGGLGFIAPLRAAWTVDDFALLDGIAAALGLWLTHPASGVAAAVSAPATVITAQVHLGERQLQILRLVEQGKSNAGIAAALGYSESTVKQDLQRALRTLRTDDRHAAVTRAREIGLLE